MKIDSEIYKEQKNVTYAKFYQKKDGNLIIEMQDLNTGCKCFMKVAQLEKVLDNAGNPVTIKKAYEKSNMGDGSGQQMIAYFPEKKQIVLYTGKVGKMISKIPDDLATNGELPMQIDIEHMNDLINGVHAYEFAVDVANNREDRKIDYLDGTVILPEGNWLQETNKTKKQGIKDD